LTLKSAPTSFAVPRRRSCGERCSMQTRSRTSSTT
jgi:hypothetical protein